MMKYFFCILFFPVSLCYAQQDPLFSQYRFDRLIINPAYAGSENSIRSILGYRQQFAGLDGAPQTQVFGIHSPILKKSMGIGLKAIHDNIGATGQTSVSAIYAYHLRLSKGKLSFGLEGGLLNQSVDFPILIKTDIDDPLLQSKESTMLPDAAFGVYYSHDKFYIGASMYHLLRGELNFSGTARTPVARLFSHSFLTGGYVIDAGESIKLEPSLLFKYVSGAPFQTDINMNFTYREMFTVGGGYRTGDAVVFFFKFQVKDKFNIGYAYDYTISKLSAYNSGSHEIMLGYNIKVKERVKKQAEPITEPIYEELITEEPAKDTASEDTLSEELVIIEEETITDTLSTDTAIQTVSIAEEPAKDFAPPKPSQFGEGLQEDTLPKELAVVEEAVKPTPEKTSTGSTKFEGVIKNNGLGIQDVSLILIKGTEVINNVKTSENGEFAFDIIQGDDYFVLIRKDGYLDKFYEIKITDEITTGKIVELEKM